MRTMEVLQKPPVHHSHLRTVIYSILFVTFLFSVYFLRNIVYVLLTSIVIASFVDFGVQKLKRLKIGRTLAVIVLYFFTITLIGTFLYLFIPVFLEQMIQFVGVINEYLPAQPAVLSSQEVVSSEFISNLQALTTSAGGGGVVSTAVSLFGGLLNVAILIVISFYLSMNERGIESFIRLVTPQPQEEYIVSLWKRTNHKIGLWFQGQLLLGLLVGVLTYLGLLILNVQYSLLLAIAAALMELIPFGIILAAIPAVAAGYATREMAGAIQVAALYTIIQQFENNLIQPLIVQKVVGVSPLVVILALLVGVQVAGVWGVILAIPVAVLLMEIIKDIEKRKAPIAE
jgi:predicted PurR-regulated permease PerM